MPILLLLQVHGNIHLLSDQVAYSNQAITLLCGAIAEVAKRCGINNGRYTRALDSLTRNAPVLPGTSAAAVHVIESSHIKPMQVGTSSNSQMVTK